MKDLPLYQKASRRHPTHLNEGLSFGGDRAVFEGLAVNVKRRASPDVGTSNDILLVLHERVESVCRKDHITVEEEDIIEPRSLLFKVLDLLDALVARPCYKRASLMDQCKRSSHLSALVEHCGEGLREMDMGFIHTRDADGNMRIAWGGDVRLFHGDYIHLSRSYWRAINDTKTSKFGFNFIINQEISTDNLSYKCWY